MPRKVITVIESTTDIGLEHMNGIAGRDFFQQGAFSDDMLLKGRDSYLHVDQVTSFVSQQPVWIRLLKPKRKKARKAKKKAVKRK